MTPYRSGTGVASERRTMDLALPIAEVTVLEDRALILRRGRVALPQGETRLTLVGLAPVLVDKSVSAVASSPEVTVADIRIVRELVLDETARPEELRELSERVERAQLAFQSVCDRRWRLSLEADGLAQLFGQYLREIAEDATLGRELGGAEQEGALRVLLKERELRREVASLSSAEAQEKRELDRWVERRRAADKPTARRSLSLSLSVLARADAEVELSLRYVVANACWRPRHRAILSGDERTLTVEALAAVWQNTGEDWESAKLWFSTERPSLGASPPKLEADWLSATRKGPLVVETREEVVERAAVEGGAKQLLSELPAIDDGGEARLIAAREPMTVRSNGEPHTASLLSFTADAAVSLVAAPELCLAAVTRVVSKNSGPQPLLPGPVELVRGGGAVGRGKLEFTASGEQLELGFGPDADLAVSREVEAIKEESSLIGSWLTKTHDVRVKLSNLGRSGKRVRVEERVLVSEIEKVKVQVSSEHTSEHAKPDENGFLRWNVDLPPRSHRTLTLRVVIKRHSDALG